MKYTLRPTLVLSLFVFSAFGFEDGVAAQAERMEPKTGKPGTVLKITGRSLDKAHVDEVFLTDHRFDMKVKVLEQTNSHLVIRIPPFVKPGRLQLLFLTPGNQPVYLEQPLFLLVEAGDDDLPTTAPAEISQKLKPSVEVASTGTSIPVPMNGAPPQSPAMSSGVEKSVVPLKPTVVATNLVQPDPVATAPAPTPAVQTPPPPVEQPRQVTTQPAPAPARTPDLPVSTPTAPPQVASSASPAVASAINPARIVQRTSVRYPPAALAQHIEGAVELAVVVRADGHVKDVKILKGNPFLVQAAVNSVREWVYEPAAARGKAVESEILVVLNFRRPE